MTTVLLPATDPRGPKAVEIATDAGQWLKCRTRDGRKAYGIRSSANSNQVYFVTRTSCTCFDGQRRTCKHQLAVALHCELVAEQKQAADAAKYDAIFGERTESPVLEMVRHADGEISWTPRNERKNGLVKESYV